MPLSAVSLLAHTDTARDMGITNPNPAMATTADPPPFTTVDTDIPVDTIALGTGVGSTPKVTEDRASRTSRLATGSSRRWRGRPISLMSALRRLRPRVRSGVGPRSTKARCRIRRKIKRTSVTGSSVRVRGACEPGRMENVIKHCVVSACSPPLSFATGGSYKRMARATGRFSNPGGAPDAAAHPAAPRPAAARTGGAG